MSIKWINLMYYSVLVWPGVGHDFLVHCFDRLVKFDLGSGFVFRHSDPCRDGTIFHEAKRIAT